MDKHEVGILSCRILSVVLFTLNAPKVLYFAGAYSSMFSRGNVGMEEIINVFSQLTPFFCTIAFAIILWVFAHKIGYFMIADMKPSENAKPIDSRCVMGVTFVLAGVYILFNTLTQLNVNLLYHLIIQSPAYMTQNQEARWTTEFIIFIVKIILGLFMLLKPYAIVDYLHRQQNRPFFNIPRDEDS